MSTATRPKRRLDQDVLTGAEVELLMRQCSNRAPTGVRNRALIAVLWRCGLRLGEALALSLKDLDFEHGRLTVTHGKNDKMRVVGLDAGTAALLQRWLVVRGKLKPSRSAPVFCTLDGSPINQSYIRHLLPRLGKKAGIEKRLHAHALRHLMAIELEREGATLSTIRDLLGHSSAAVTDRYLRRLGASEAVEFAQGRSWQPS